MTADVAIAAAGRVDAASIEVEDVGGVSVRVGSRGPVADAPASVEERFRVTGEDVAAPHKE